MRAFADAAAGGSTRSCSCSRARCRTRRSTARATGPASASTRETGQPIPTYDLDRPAGAARGRRVLALGTCAAYGGIPAMKNNPTGAMGLRDYLGLGLALAARPAGREPARLPGAAGQHHRDAARAWCCTSPASGRRSSWTSRAGRVRCSAARCTRAATAPGFAEHGAVRRRARRRPLPGEARLPGPVVKCNVPMRGWVNGIGGCPNVGGICMACTMPGFPDKYMPFMDADRLGLRARPRHAVHVRPRAALLPPAQHRAQVRRRAGVAQALARADVGLREALVAAKARRRRASRPSRCRR